MQIDRALILSAGLGTRMGQIGTKIPKVLWPVFNKSLLELQIDYCNELGIKEIYINTHFLHDEIVCHLKQKALFDKVKILYENPLLDSGGAIHNLASQKEINYSGTVLLINADQFLFFDKSYFKEALEKITHFRAVLFGICVNSNSAYNETVIQNGRLVEIKKPTREYDYVTYSGLGVLKLDGLKPVKEASKFFETVTDYKKENIGMIAPKKFEYWDFGTAKIYAENILKISKSNDSEFSKFLEKNNVDRKNVKNFLNIELASINLDYEGKFAKDSIVADGITQTY